MIRRSIITSLCITFAAFALSVLTSCTVDENAALETRASATGSKTKKTEVKTGSKESDSKELSRSEKVKADQEARDAGKAKAAAEKAKLAAAKAKEEEAAAKKLAASKKTEDAAKAKVAQAEERKLAAEKKAEAAKKAGELVSVEKSAKEKAVKEAAEKKAREEALALKEKEREALKLAKLEEKKKADQGDAAAPAQSSGGGGFFSLLSSGPSTSQYKSKGHDVFVNRMLLPTLNPSNAKIEISLGEQRARVYRNDGVDKVLIIETKISSGKSGYGTSTGTFSIKEKLVEKRSTIYGSWISSGGQTVGGSSEVGMRPSGGSRFVGAEMPYWMRINGGIGMHVGFVPDYPASHGCVRVPAAIQPLIFSKVGVGTTVTITH